MKLVLFILLTLVGFKSYSQKSDTIRIENDSLEYEITIIDPGFDFWLKSNARPRGFYGLSYLETYNSFYVTEWNNRFFTYNNKNLFMFPIDYDSNIKYGYEVNYLLFNYFQYFMFKTGQYLGPRRRVFYD